MRSTSAFVATGKKPSSPGIFLGAAAADLFSVPEGTRAVVRVAEVAQGTPLTVLVLGGSGQ